MLITTCFRLLGILLMIFSLSFLPCIGISYYYHDQSHTAFFSSLFFTLLVGALLWFPFRNYKRNLRTQDGFIIVVLFWSVVSIFGALPLYLIKAPDIPLVDAIFESISGLTTTGSTVLTQIDQLPASVLYYRQQLQFLGGMGIILLAVAILPMLGIGGLQLFRAEITGPIKDNKLTPRIAETAKALWYIYVGLNIACIIAYYVAGMPLFDAICYAFSTVSTGGYANYQGNFSIYDSRSFELIASFFMLLGSISFTLHFIALRQFSLRHYFQNEELRSYIYRVFVITLIAFAIIWAQGNIYENFIDGLIDVFFQVTSLLSTAGFTTDAFAKWPSIVGVLVFFAAMIGGCTSSTSGGVKTLRFIALFKQSFREIKRLVHPHAEFPLKLYGKQVDVQILDAIWGYIGIYLLTLFFVVICLMATGLDFYEAFSSGITSLSNIGPGLGSVAETFANVTVSAKIILSIAMFLGRLELFTVFVLFLILFWRR